MAALYRAALDAGREVFGIDKVGLLIEYCGGERALANERGVLYIPSVRRDIAAHEVVNGHGIAIGARHGLTFLYGGVFSMGAPLGAKIHVGA